ncbi:hypothetical protein D3C72_1201810 [compost metagenome]
MQRREHPAGGAGQVDMAQQLLLVGAQHARVGQHHRAHFLDALVDVEEDDEEHQRHGQRHLRPDPQPEPDREDRRQDHARHRVGRLHIGIEHGRGERAQRQPQPHAQPGHRADAEGQHRLQQRHAQVNIDVALDDEPAPDALRHHQRLAEEERHLLRARGRMPHPQDHHQHQQLPHAQHALRIRSESHIVVLRVFVSSERVHAGQATLRCCA